MLKEIVVVASGYFDPIHAGHIEYLEKAKALGDRLIVIINNTKQAILKKGYEFMPLDERVKILKQLNASPICDAVIITPAGAEPETTA